MTNSVSNIEFIIRSGGVFLRTGISLLASEWFIKKEMIAKRIVMRNITSICDSVFDTDREIFKISCVNRLRSLDSVRISSRKIDGFTFALPLARAPSSETTTT